jgi:NitT/TauT family transport system substrate-binding protein
MKVNSNQEGRVAIMHLSLRKDSRAATLVHLLLATGFALLPSSGCRKKAHGPVPPPVPITIACPRNISAGLVIIANGKGYLARGGAQTTLRPFESGKDSLECMLGGGADLAVVAETPIARAILEDRKLKILACIHQSTEDLAIVARKDKGITRPADLRGKVIGYAQGTNGQYFLDTYCLVNRIHPAEFHSVDLSPLQQRMALLEGRVDAVSTWNPHVEILANALGTQAVVFREEFIYTQCMFVVARPEFIRDHSTQVKVLLEGLCSALDDLTRSPGEAGNLVAAYVQVEPSLVAKAFTARTFDVRLDQSQVLSLENGCHWFADSQAVSRRTLPEVLPYFHLAGLLEVRPQAVQVIRDKGKAIP